MSARDSDEDHDGPPEYGVRSSELGSFVPEGAYRPLPIVWCAGAWLIQIFVLPWVVLLMLRLPPAVPALTAGLITFWIARWTWGRGMATASRAWQVFTALVLAVNLAGAVAMAFAERAQGSVP